MKNEITYERTINKSYMKLPALNEDNLDVRIMLQRKIKGMIPVERCFINGQGQYWYDISGKQALDNFVQVQLLEYSIFEILILRICEQLEILEWNLLDENGLQMDPQFIFLDGKGENIFFVFYPQRGNNILKEFQKLLEYLLTKLDHEDRDSVKGAYELYEITQKETYQVQELKNCILKRRIEIQKEQELAIEVTGGKVAEREVIYGGEDMVETGRKISLPEQIEEKLSELCEKAKNILVRKPKEEIPMVVYPKEEEEEEKMILHPTICIATTIGEPRGILIYEGMGEYPDFELDKTICVIGKSHRANMQIERDTVSQFHAKIEYVDGYFIEDMNSTNGTFVNDEIVNYREKRQLNAGDVLRFADVKYRFL